MEISELLEQDGVLPHLKAGNIKALAHITGGGLVENIPRSLPKGLDAYLKADHWKIPPVFIWLQKMAQLPPEEMLKTFNCGVGMVVICSPDKAKDLLSFAGAVEIGIVKPSGGGNPRCYVCSETGALGQKGPWQTKPAGEK